MFSKLSSEVYMNNNLFKLLDGVYFLNIKINNVSLVLMKLVVLLVFKVS